jgi:hypothetical protein
MASIITATTTSGLTQSADNSGVLQLASGAGNLVTVPSVTGTMLTTASTIASTGPAFAAYPSAASTAISNSTWTKATLDTEVYDTNSNFASSRFTPTVAGYYQINFTPAGASANNNGFIYGGAIYKNGSAYAQNVVVTPAGDLQGFTCQVSQLIYMNGSSDYLEFWVNVYALNGTVSYGGGATTGTLASGFLARSA